MQVAFSADSSLAALTSYTNKVQILAILNGTMQTLELPSVELSYPYPHRSFRDASVRRREVSGPKTFKTYLF